MELTQGELATAVADEVGKRFQEGMKSILAEFNAQRDEADDSEKTKAALAAMEEKYTALEAEFAEQKRAVAEQKFTPVGDDGYHGKLRYPLDMHTLTHPADDEATMAGQKLNDEMYTLLRCLSKPDEGPKNKQAQADLLMSTKSFLRYKQHYGKAIDTATSGQGLEWVPQGYSNQMFDAVFIAARVAGLFGTITMPTPTYIAPVQLARPKAYRASEGLARTASTTDLTDDATFTAKALAVYVPVTQEATEDMFLPILSWLQAEMAAGLGDGIEACILNGDTTATHMDNDLEDLGAGAVETAWDGLRHYGMGTSGCSVDLSTFNADTILGLKSAMGKYGIRPDQLAWIVGPVVLNKLLLLRDAQNNLMMTTLDKYGSNATILTGEVGKMFGIPVVPSASCREDVSASGYNTADGPNTKATMILVNRKAWFNGDRKSLTLESQKDIETQIHKLVASWRGDFRTPFPAGQKHTTCGYNI